MTTRSDALRDRELARFRSSGWARLPDVRDRIPIDPARFLAGHGSRWWARVHDLGEELGHWMVEKRFARDVELGLLFVPAIRSLDTRGAMDVRLRRTQREDLLGDVFDERLDAGVDLVPDGSDGMFFVTCVGRYGVALGSYQKIHTADPGGFMVTDTDVRAAMTRQLWGARVLQSGDRFLPDCEANDRWTFTLFAGEDLVDGLAQSGTILKSRVRYRLGKPDRGIGSARVAPAVPVPW